MLEKLIKVHRKHSQVVDIPTGDGGLVFPQKNRYYLINHERPSGNNAELREKKGTPTLTTNHILVCGGIYITTPLSYTLLHSTHDNTETLLDAFLEGHKRLDVPVEEVRVSIISNLPDVYMRRVKDYFHNRDIELSIENMSSPWQSMKRTYEYSLIANRNSLEITTERRRDL